jgi:hypothetical protein
MEHVPGNLNPADDGSRGMKILAFQPSCRWWTGPSFLWQPEECWPIQHVGDVPDTDIEQISEKYVMVIAPSALVDELLLWQAISAKRWSSLKILVEKAIVNRETHVSYRVSANSK